MTIKHPNALLCSFVVSATLLAGCASDYDRSSGRVIDDRSIASKVQHNLKASPVYKFPHVTVATYNGTVQLSGFVYEEEQKNEAGDLAKRVPGVSQVINSISMAPPAVGGTGTRHGDGSSGRDTNAPPPSSSSSSP